MDLAALTGFLATLGSVCGLIYAVYTVRQMNKKIESFREIGESVSALFRYQEDENGEPMIDARLGKLIEIGSAALSKSLRMSFLGGLSGQARLEKGLKGAIAQDVVEEKMPIISLVGDFMGINTKKYISKHPEALAQILQMAAPLLQGQGFGVVGSNPQKGWKGKYG